MMMEITWDDQWIGYDDESTIARKKAWADDQYVNPQVQNECATLVGENSFSLGGDIFEVSTPNFLTHTDFVPAF
jgi:hypothetical protein